MTRLADFLPKYAESTAVRIEDIAGEKVMVTEFRLTEGPFGEFAFVDAVRENGELVTFITGAKLVLEALKAADDAEAFPCEAVFTKKGRRWTIE